jgi:4-carboxymuconolactone decarboxylase
MSQFSERRMRGLDVLSTLAGSEQGGTEMARFLESRGAVGSIALLTGAGEVWARDQLSRRDRSLVVISTLTALGPETELRAHISGGLQHGLRDEEVDEIFVQVAAYAGLPVALAGAGLAADVLAARDGSEVRRTPPAPLQAKSAEERRADGLDVLTTLLGQPDLDTQLTEQQIQSAQGFLGDLVMDYAFGEVWSRPQLSRRDRSLVVISVLTALNLPHELEIHLQGALNHGLTRDEIEEMLITMVVYGGFPRAIDGMNVARRVFASRDASGHPPA